MAATTTLMTFLVRTPSNTRSVQLFGSWDNFTVSYPMQRDTRLGAEHWSGCHSFSNIICDGRMEMVGKSRDGGLKMGGTYWYYYRLDDEIDFHNSAEPSTSRCPMLPGQLVNVLQMPVVLSGSRNRNASVSSTSSDIRTLNPNDKFLNPRAVPTPPKMVRLNTSPSLPQQSQSNASSPVYAHSNASLSRSSSRENLHATPKASQLRRKASYDTFSRSNSTKKSTGFRQAFRRVRTGRSQSPNARYKEILDWTPDHGSAAQFESAQAINTTSVLETRETDDYFSTKASPAPTSRGLLLRTNSEESLSTKGFLQHRRERSRSRGASSARNSVILDNGSQLDVYINAPARSHGVPLSALIEVASPQAAYDNFADQQLPVFPQPVKANLQLEKRLPTLPNTPSSAYPPSLLEGSQVQNMEDDILNLESHFSTTTIDSACHLDSIVMNPTSRFSEWSMDGDTLPSATASTFEEDLSSPVSAEYDAAPAIRQVSFGSDRLDIFANDSNRNGFLPTTLDCSTICSSMTDSPSFSPIDRQSIRSFHTRSDTHSSIQSIGQYQHYSLPQEEAASEVTLKNYNTHERSTSRSSNRDTPLQHSEGMRQLLDELSYLSEFIHVERERL